MGVSRSRRAAVPVTVSVAALIAAIESDNPDRLFVARALDPILRDDLSAALDYEELPFVRGRTVIPGDIASTDLVVAGHPSHLGVFDMPMDVPWIAVTGRWSALFPLDEAQTQVSVEPVVERDTAETSLGEIRSLAQHLTHMRGVTVVFPPACPVIIVLLVVDPVAVTAGADLPGSTALEAYTELPGGLRIELPPAAPRSTLEGYAAALEQAIAAVEVESSHRWK